MDETDEYWAKQVELFTLEQLINNGGRKPLVSWATRLLENTFGLSPLHAQRCLQLALDHGWVINHGKFLTVPMEA